MTSVQIITDHVREEANKWRRLSGDMQEVYQSPVEGGLELGLSSFFIGPTEVVPAAIHYDSYSTFLNHFKTLTLGAVIEWEQIQGALNWMADEFDRADEIAVESIKAVWTERTTSDGSLTANPDASASDGRRPAHEPQ
ncbi:hypothetical protein AB0M20_27635 [Actinoplanes sp. NPDC051633]|uniref:hypothetical protein n=1 Tax=Actinoplanes sp. NPDC051633 TaxID=3155670 RepID=UPI003431D167